MPDSTFSTVLPALKAHDNGDGTYSLCVHFANGTILPAQISLASGKILIGDAGNLASAQVVSGDATLSNAGVLTLQKDVRLFVPTGLYWHPYPIQNFGYGVIVADKLYAAPLYFPPGMSFDRYAVEIRTGLAGKFRMGFYTSKNPPATAYPDALVAGSDVAEIDMAAGGVKVVTFAFAPTPGILYWFAFTGNAAFEMRTGVNCLLTFPKVVDFNNFDAHYISATAYGALPANFPAAAPFGGSIVFGTVRVAFRFA